MCQLRLYLISLATVRDYFGNAADRGRLRTLAQERFAFDRAPRMGMLGKLGPMLAKPRLPIATAGELPTRDDAETILAGHAVSADRRPYAWQIVGHWIASDAVSALRMELTWADLCDVDAAAIRAGLDLSLSVQALFDHDPDLALAPLPSMQLGCLWTPRSLAMADAFASLPPSETSGTQLGELGAWLGQLPGFVAAARDAGKRAPDIFAVFTHDT